MLILHSKRCCTTRLSASLSLSANEYLYCTEEDEDEVAVDDADSIVDATEGALAASLDLLAEVVDAVLLLKGLTNNACIMTTQLYGIRLLASP